MSLEDDPDYKKIKLESHKAFILNMMKGNSATESYSLAFPDAKRTTQTAECWVVYWAALVGWVEYSGETNLNLVAVDQQEVANHQEHQNLDCQKYQELLS